MGDIELPKCGGCGEPIEIDSPCYAVQSGYIGDDGKFVRQDVESQLFHIGKSPDCMNSGN